GRNRFQARPARPLPAGAQAHDRGPAPRQGPQDPREDRRRAHEAHAAPRRGPPARGV
ncbi:MAG: hypothetical protein AVDCRST_MAG13-474, partial [uncultured Solirubrobacteraceae bacterium]